MGEWMYRSIFSWLPALGGGKWSASRTGRFTPGERVPGTHWIGGWVNPRACLDDLEKRKFLTLPRLELHTFGRPGRSQSLLPTMSLDLSIDLTFQPHYGLGVDPASNRNEYQESSWGVQSGRRVRLPTLRPSVGRLFRKMWKPRRLTTLQASTACYRESFTFKITSYLIF
jgi:hypothetical protein